MHGHGGQLLEHHKNQGLGWDLKPGGAADVVLDDRVDDVERARLGAVAALVDRDARRRPGVAGPARAVAARGAAAPDRDGRPPAVPDGVPQGRARARARARPELDPRAVHRRLAAACRGLRVRVRAARLRGAADQRLGRHRRVHGDRVGLVRAARVRGRDLRPLPRRRRPRVRPRRQRARRRARRARDHLADAVDAGRVVGRPRRRALPQLVLRPLSRDLAPGRLDQVHRARQLRDHGPLGRDAEPWRRAARHRRVLRRRRGAARGRSTRSWSTSRMPAAAAASCCCSSSRRTGADARRRAARRNRGRAPRRALAASRPRS